jgi:hypothetical protein
MGAEKDQPTRRTATSKIRTIQIGLMRGPLTFSLNIRSDNSTASRYERERLDGRRGNRR